MAVVGAITAVAALGYGVYSGERGAQQQKQAVRKQEQAQKDNLASAAAAQRAADAEQRKANARKPDVTSLLASEQQQALSGPSSTMLTGSSGAARGSMKLGQTSMLGG